MAEVYKAVSYGVEGFERLFAVKRVLPQISEDQEFIDMFIDEAKIAVQLTHANIGQVFELGNADNSYFISMEFVQGKDCRALFDRASTRGEHLPIPMCCHIIKEVCEALEYAHNKRNDRGEPLKLIHRDVSPQNILVSYEGEVKLIDFGIAKAAGKASKTQAGILKGKFSYMSPEQVRGKPIDKRSDLFSLAVCLYELLTLERCFQGESDFSTLEKVREVEVRKPTQINRAIPPELERIIYRGLARDPEQRYQSAAEFQDALQKFLYQSGAFYSRKDLAAYMRGTFSRELAAEQQRVSAFRTYARQ
ncbi:MAG: serine/threonine protein kinase, partial [Myxococcales bacterium]|nr:serine/threonine protein kinase [Myxococcales bacterium]